MRKKYGIPRLGMTVYLDADVADWVCGVAQHKNVSPGRVLNKAVHVWWEVREAEKAKAEPEKGDLIEKT